jgi:hypothetical protein
MITYHGVKLIDVDIREMQDFQGAFEVILPQFHRFEVLKRRWTRRENN